MHSLKFARQHLKSFLIRNWNSDIKIGKLKIVDSYKFLLSIMALTILQWNARGLRGNKEQLKNFILKACIPPDVVCVEETFLKDQHESPKLDGYNIIRKDCLSRSEERRVGNEC